ncbi:MAG: carbohydrate ABC transporter permease [Clostridia bacterium]|nr:carbohydrate ABC transporter permease [Clostridia bacterium]
MNISVKTKQKIGKFAFGVFRAFFLIGMAYVLLFPLLVMVTRAIRPYSDMYNPSIVWIPSRLTLENFGYALEALGGMSAVLKTLRIVLLSTLLSMFTCSMAGYGLARFRIKLTPLFVLLAALTVIVPIQTYVIPLFFEFRFFDFFGLGSLIGLFTGESATVNLTTNEAVYYLLSILGVSTRNGIFILLFMLNYKSVPGELEMAARVDGAGEWRTYFQIMLPNALPSFVVTFVMSMVWVWNDSFFPSIVYRQDFFLAKRMLDIRTLANNALGISSYATNLSETNIMFAACIIFVLPLLIMYMFAQKLFIQSAERSGITG